MGNEAMRPSRFGYCTLRPTIPYLEIISTLSILFSDVQQLSEYY